MDEEGIGLVLGRASELRSKITNCIHNSSSNANGAAANGANRERGSEDNEDNESLLNIRDALESLEAQLSSLQSLQQQQWYEKEASLAEIDYSRKKLLQKLNEYKGDDDDLEVIHEAISFASSTVEIESNDLLLPPYPTPRPSRSLAHFPFTHKTNEPTPTIHRSSTNGWKRVMGAATKTVLTLVGFIAVMGLLGFEGRIGKRDNGTDGDENGIGCPPGRVLVVENGETRCLVKERVEIPFVSVSTMPDVNYGCG